ncbi:hypothetical protein KC340_g4966 [Hortaea werneckii]|nr:hypothetical protein KC342_g14297 [Hortaea werneckii]KAI7067486.1 hypothetical protein KC339_g15292 [Hortaea werneckii]KAI7204796.1 hypothetical protein KC365_g17852 [Hortaea werneckii]KAI7328726.1 hypothetical protein KC340_g4966 [Hortaea werneckii]KAI7376258.1 hypothetical protein KC328_g14987 [Hortaea werneckii]
MVETQAREVASAPSYSHGVEHIPYHTHSATRTAARLGRRVPQRIDEVHLKIQEQALHESESQQLRRRQQGTAVSSESTSSTTASPSTDATESTSASSSIPESSSSGTESSASTSSGTESSTSISGVGVSAANSASSTGSTSSINSSTGSRSLSLIVSTDTGSSDAASKSPASTGAGSSLASSLSGNLTTSAIILDGSSTTITSRTTINLASQTSQSSSSSSSSSSATDSSSSISSSSLSTQTTSSLGDLVYLATLQNGAVQTITRAQSDYATTFSGGQVSTIAAYSGSLDVSTDDNGATSTYYTTVMPTTDANGGQSTITSTALLTPGANAADATFTSTAAASTSSAAGGGGGGSNDSAPAGTIAGGVVGGAAGLAVVLVLALLFLRWSRRKAQAGHQALPPNSGMLPEDEDPPPSGPSQPGMAERAGLRPIIGAVPAMFRHQSRESESTATTEPTERGFTRVSGRKLPSSFSPGMNSPPPTMPLTGPERNLSSTSFYRDSAGFYGGEGIPQSPATAAPPTGESPPEGLTLSPGPQRRPTVHAGGPYKMSSPASAAAAAAASPSSPQTPQHPPAAIARSPPLTGSTATFDRSETPTSLDPTRSSRFTEEV